MTAGGWKAIGAAVAAAIVGAGAVVGATRVSGGSGPVDDRLERIEVKLEEVLRLQGEQGERIARIEGRLEKR